MGAFTYVPKDIPEDLRLIMPCQCASYGKLPKQYDDSDLEVHYYDCPADYWQGVWEWAQEYAVSLSDAEISADEEN
jgi:hypothetical protein